MKICCERKVLRLRVIWFTTFNVREKIPRISLSCYNCLAACIVCNERKRVRALYIVTRSLHVGCIVILDS